MTTIVSIIGFNLPWSAYLGSDDSDDRLVAVVRVTLDFGDYSMALVSGVYRRAHVLARSGDPGKSEVGAAVAKSVVSGEGFWVLQGLVYLAGEVSLQAADDVTLGQSFGGASGDVIQGVGSSLCDVRTSTAR